MKIGSYELDAFNAWLGSRTKREIMGKLRDLFNRSYEGATTEFINARDPQDVYDTFPERKKVMKDKDILEWWAARTPEKEFEWERALVKQWRLLHEHKVK